jgi:hypothetical protein
VPVRKRIEEIAAVLRHDLQNYENVA